MRYRRVIRANKEKVIIDSLTPNIRLFLKMIVAKKRENMIEFSLKRRAIK